MNAKVADLMVTPAITTIGHKSIEHVKDIMQNNKIHSVPVLNEEGEPIGIITTSDLLKDYKAGTPVSKVMSEGKVYTVPQYADIHIAARIMRNHRIHHLVVTDEQKAIGVVSAFDLLQLVEDHRFVMKNAPTAKKKRKTQKENI